MADAAVIRLGGRQFEVRALTFRQLRDIEAALGRALQAGPPARIDFDAAVDVIAAALRRSDPAIDRDAILDLEGTKSEFVAATRAVLRLSGYIESGESAPGEEQAGN
ncbi:MAG TPA: hypothetical protein VH020_03255 [Stellaceae bacterium]|jgi:hypothetical protein|nr:hypothetical protein [Stellaceae bacterium]